MQLETYPAKQICTLKIFCYRSEERREWREKRITKVTRKSIAILGLQCFKTAQS